MLSLVLHRWCLDSNPEQEFSNVNFLRPLVKAMTHPDPDARLDAMSALQQWQTLRGHVFFLQRGWRLRRSDEEIVQTVVLDIVWLLRLSLLPYRRFARYMARFL